GSVNTPSPRNFRDATLNGNFARPVFGGRLSLTGQLDAWRYHVDNGLNFFNLNNVNTENFESILTEHQWSFETGLNYDRDLGPWSLALVGLLNRRYYKNQELDTDANGASVVNSIFHQQQQRNSGETILRAALSRDFGPANHFEFGVEGAFNT